MLTRTGIALQAFVNGGGIYIGNTTGGERGPFCRRHADRRPEDDRGLLTPGSTFDATFDTTNPVAWGFDLGGWIYRESSGNPVLDGRPSAWRQGGRVLRCVRQDYHSAIRRTRLGSPTGRR